MTNDRKAVIRDSLVKTGKETVPTQVPLDISLNPSVVVRECAAWTNVLNLNRVREQCSTKLLVSPPKAENEDYGPKN